MLESYDVLMGSNVVGSAEVLRTGLFYMINCSCEPPEKGEYRIVVFCESKRIELGCCTRNKTLYQLVRQIPMKTVGVGQLHFVLERNDFLEEFIPIESALSAFPLNVLPLATFMVKGVEAGLLICDRNRVIP